MKNILLLSLNLILLWILLIFTYKVSSHTPTNHVTRRHTSEYIKESCKTTLYPKVCYKSLAKHANEIKKSPKILATYALGVTLTTTRSTSKIFRKLSRNRALRQSEVKGLLECVEEVSDSVYELQKSMKELNHSRKGPKFGHQMNDIQTWVSAALTDDDTCLDDFRTRGKIKTLVRRLILRIARLTSISLAFINNYAEV